MFSKREDDAHNVLLIIGRTDLYSNRLPPFGLPINPSKNANSTDYSMQLQNIARLCWITRLREHYVENDETPSRPSRVDLGRT